MTGTDNVEREVKLDVGLRFALPDLNGVLPGVVARTLADARLQAVYVDTPDLRLMRWGITLRHRHDSSGGTGESDWTVKLPHDAEGVALVRREVSWPGKFGPVPPEVLSLVRAQARSVPLEPVAKLSTQRRRVELRDSAGRRLAEIDDDIVSVMDGRRLAARFRQVEVEVVGADANELLAAVLQRMTAAGALAGDDRPKVVRALGPRAVSPPDVVVPRLGGDATVADVVGAAIASAVTRIIRHDPGVRLGDDPEHVHQARVGTRRLRSDLRTFRSLLDQGWTTRMRDELGWLADALGRVRDADVLTERLRAEIAQLPEGDARPAAGLLRRLALQREAARADLLAVLDSQRYVALLDHLAEAATHPPLADSAADARPPLTADGAAAPAPLALAAPAALVAPAVAAPAVAAPAAAARAPGGPDPGAEVAASVPVSVAAGVVGAGGPAGWGTRRAGSGQELPGGVVPAPVSTNGASPPPPPLGEQAAADVLPELVRTPWRHLRRAVAALGDDPADAALHEVRIRAKRLRYAAEAAAPVIGKPAKQLAVAVADVQGVLGDMQDAVVAEDWLRQSATSGPSSQAVIAGILIASQRRQQAACRDAWTKPWRKASSKRLRGWLKG